MKRHRQSYRLKGYDYSGCGCYYITICTQYRKCLLGEVIDGEMVLNRSGRIARDEWLRSADVRSELRLDGFVVMPNHIHGIVFLDGQKGDPPVVGAGQTIWQRNYHDHIVRNDSELTKIRQYITDNPRYWETDDHHVPQDKKET
ncbi:MAG: transposase [bacterium]|nr:transposase [bacterium]